MKSGKLLVAVIVLQSLILISQWSGGRQAGVPIPLESTAYGQIPDAAGQRMQVIDELKAMNGKMDRLMDLMKSGDLQVRLSKPDEKK